MTAVGNVGGDFSGLLFGKLYTVQAWFFAFLLELLLERHGRIEGQAFSASWQGAAVLPAKLLRCKLGMKRCLLITRTVISVDQVLFSPSLWKCRND